MAAYGQNSKVTRVAGADKVGAEKFKFRDEMVMIKKALQAALVGVAQWIECQTANQRVTGSIPSQGTYLCCRLVPSRGVREAAMYRCFSPSLLTLSEKKNKSNLKKKKKRRGPYRPIKKCCWLFTL